MPQKKKRGRPRKATPPPMEVLSRPPGQCYLWDIDRHLFCDLQILCRDGFARCHKVVLAAISSRMSKALEDADVDCLFMPDLTMLETTTFLDTVYAALVAGGETKFPTEFGPEFQIVCNLLKVDCELLESSSGTREQSFVSAQVIKDPLMVEDPPNEEVPMRKMRKRKAVKYEEEDNHVEPHIIEAENQQKPLEEQNYENNQPKPYDGKEVEIKNENADGDCEDSVKIEPEDFDSNSLVVNNASKMLTNQIDDKAIDELEQAMSEEKVRDMEENVKAKEDEIREKVYQCSGKVQASLNQDFDWSVDNCTFATVIGIKSDSEGAYLARPLAWSSDKQMLESERFGQYKAFCQSAKFALGLSEADVKHNLKLRSRLGISRDSLRHNQRSKLSDYSKEELEKVLEQEDTKKIVLPETRNEPLQIDNNLDINFTFDSSLQAKDVQQIGVLKLTLSGDFCLELIGKSDKMNADPSVGLGARLIKLLFDVWSLKGIKQDITQSDPIHKDYIAVYEIARQAAVAKEFLENWDKTTGDRLLKEKVCPECKESFPFGTLKDQNAFRHHTERHFIEGHQCDCPDQSFLKSFHAKRSHVRLFHLQGFASCQHPGCSWVATPKGIKGHFEQRHKEITCELCSCKVHGKYGLVQHRASFHTDRPDVKGKEKGSTAGTCSQCGRFYLNLTRHVKSIHQQMQHPCDVCGQTFNRRSVLNSHRIRLHFPELKSHKCEICPERFENRDGLRNHIYKFHLKMKLYKCRYEGCDMRYDETGSRGNHERIKHGHPHGKAVKLGLVPPLKKTKSPFPNHIPSVDEIKRMLSEKTK